MLTAARTELGSRLQASVAKGKLCRRRQRRARALSFTTDLAAAANADFVIEAATERLDIKRRSSPGSAY